MNAWFWTRFPNSDRRWSRPAKNNELPRNSFARLELVVVSETRGFLDYQLAGAPITPNEQHINIWNEVRSTLHGDRRLSAVWLKSIEFHWEDPHLNMDAVFRPGIDTPIFSSACKDFQMGSTEKTRFWSMTSKTRKTFILHEPQSLSYTMSVPGCRKNFFLERK